MEDVSRIGLNAHSTVQRDNMYVKCKKNNKKNFAYGCKKHRKIG